jgi:O-antigen/teichoic acid export membrane protein
MLRVTALAGIMAAIAIAILLLGGRPLVSLLFGDDFVGAFDALMILMLVPFIGVLTFPLPPMLYALDRPDGPLKARLAGMVAYFAIVAPLCWELGVNGAAVAFVIGNVATALVMMWQLRQEHRRVRPGKAVTP